MDICRVTTARRISLPPAEDYDDEISDITMHAVIAADGQINRYINPAWLEMDANSEYYPGGEVISQILQAYGLAGTYAPPRYTTLALDRNGYGRSYYPRNPIVNNLNNIYDSDPLAHEYLDRNYDYVDNAAGGSNRYRNNLINIQRRSRINAVSVPRTTYHPLEYADRSLQLLPYSGSRSAIADPIASQELLLRGRETARLIPRSTVAPTNTNEKHKM